MLCNDIYIYVPTMSMWLFIQRGDILVVKRDYKPFFLININIEKCVVDILLNCFVNKYII